MAKEETKTGDVVTPTKVGGNDQKVGDTLTETDGPKVPSFVNYAWPDSYEGMLHNQNQPTSGAILVGYNSKDKVASLLVLPNSTHPPFHVVAVPKGDEKTPGTYF